MIIKQSYRWKSASNLGGFTLIEAMVAMAVVGILIGALYSGVTWGMGNYQRARETMRATEILTEKLDSVRLFNWDQITNGTSIPASFTASFDAEKDPNRGKAYAYAYAYGQTNGNNGNAGGNGNGNGNGNSGGNGYAYGQTNKSKINYSGTLSISNAPSDVTYNGDLRYVTASVRWTNAVGAVRTRSMTTFVSKNGLQNYIY
jgi:prepilin-type N-terminal cleavage/methylation domain-containing protein